MHWFKNLKTGSKLSLSFSLFILILGFVICLSLWTNIKLSKISEDLYDKQLRLVDDVMKMDDDNNNIQLLLFNLLLTSKTEREHWIQLINQYTNEQANRQNEIKDKIKDDLVFGGKIEQFLNIENENHKLRAEQFLPSLNRDNIEDAKTLVIGKMADNFQKMSDLADDMVADARAKAMNALQAAKSEINKTSIYFLTIGIIAIIACIFLVRQLNKLIAAPLKEISLMAEKISRGEIASHNTSFKKRKDEVGILWNSFSQMTKWLQTMTKAATEISEGNLSTKISLQSEKDMLGSAFQTMINNLKTLTSEMSNSIHVLTSSSNEIASASSQLSASTQEAASSINETTSTIEEVKQTSQMASKKAKSVSESAKKTAELSDTGKNAVNEVNDAINLINNQMNLIAETMMRLNEQTQAVGSIISTVEDLAQQTNLLSVNAAIEASKAGEQGKGFSVVAQEVKSLANQSKLATNQVKGILSDIQKAASAAVMATELGSKAVENGVNKITLTSDAIVSLVKTVNESAQSATQIAAVSHQQLVGMEQAAIAMENIKQASFQNAESTKLLQNSVLNFKEMAERLKELTKQYKLE